MREFLFTHKVHTRTHTQAFQTDKKSDATKEELNNQPFRYMMQQHLRTNVHLLPIIKHLMLFFHSMKTSKCHHFPAVSQSYWTTKWNMNAFREMTLCSALVFRPLCPFVIERKCSLECSAQLSPVCTVRTSISRIQAWFSNRASSSLELFVIAVVTTINL